MNTEWKLEKYFYNSINDKLIASDLDIYDAKVNRFISVYKGKLKELVWNTENGKEGFEMFLNELSVLSIEAERVLIYLALISSLETQNQEIQKEMARLSKIFDAYHEKFLFIDEEYKAIGYDRFIKLSELENMKPYKNYIIGAAKALKYLLSEQEEKVVIKMYSANSSNLYEELTTAFEFDFRGEKMTEDEIRATRHDQDRTKRLDAVKSLSSVYSKKANQIVLGNLYSIVCKQNVADMEMRKYATVMSQRNESEEVSDSTVDSLLKNVSENYNIYQKFLYKKAVILGVEKLETQDIFAPFPVETEEPVFTFEEGWNLYEKTIEKVDPILLEFSKKMIEGSRISVYPREGKTSGAYAQYTKFLDEFVLLNWADSSSDVSTLAHELGHAFHGHLSKEQNSLVYNTPLILAETASIFNETLMFETLLENTKDEDSKKKLICSRLNDLFSTIFRQVAYILFEKRCHESFQKNEPLAFDDYNRIWSEEMNKLYGDAVQIDDELQKHMWSSISHIYHTPFYCYTYAFGNIISLNIYQAFKEADNKSEFLEKYHRFLAAGGSDTPENLLNNIFGIKFDESFYKLAFTNIEDLINKL